MDDRDPQTLARFEARFAAIEAHVKDPPPFALGRRTMAGLKRTRRSLAAVIGVAGLVVVVVVLAPRVANDGSPGPASGTGNVADRTQGPSPRPTASARSSPAAAPFPSDVGPILDATTVIDRAASLDGTRLAMRGYVMADASRQRICGWIMESYPPGCGAPTITLVGALPRDVLEQLDTSGRPGEVLGEIEVAGTFHADGDDGPFTLMLEAARAVPTVRVGAWVVRCLDVGEADCIGASGRFVDALGEADAAVFGRTGGMLSVWPRPACPRVPAGADGAVCWQVLAETALPTGDPWCMVVAKSLTGAGLPPYIHVGGPDGSGAMPRGWPACD